jgi:hypothetical protein
LILGSTNRCLAYTDFETDRKEATLDYLKQFLDNAKVGVTAETYIRMEEQLGGEIDPDKIPPSFEDFPLYVHQGVEIFNALPDTYSGGMSSMYVGKNYSSLEIFFSLYLIEGADRLSVFEVIKFLDGRARDASYKEAKKSADKASKG